MQPYELKNWRIERKLTIQEAAKKLGISEQNIRDYESEIQPIPRMVEMLIKFNP